MQRKCLSGRLRRWARDKEPKTIGSLLNAFSEESFSIILIVLMFFPAIPIPTAGFTHLFELIAMLLGVELLLGRKTIWLPNKWMQRSLDSKAFDKTLSILVRFLQKAEKIFRPLGEGFLENQASLRIIGLLIFFFSFVAFIAPPFSNLDTLPAMAVVLLAMSVIFKNLFLFLSGLFVGALGVSLDVVLGRIIINL